MGEKLQVCLLGLRFLWSSVTQATVTVASRYPSTFTVVTRIHSRSLPEYVHGRPGRRGAGLDGSVSAKTTILISKFEAFPPNVYPTLTLPPHTAHTQPTPITPARNQASEDPTKPQKTLEPQKTLPSLRRPYQASKCPTRPPKRLRSGFRVCG